MAGQQKRLYRSSEDRVLTGVLGGLAEYFDVEPSLVRIGYSVLTVLTGWAPGIILYAGMVIIIPRRPTDSPGE
jgi:phage shock protein C